MYKQLFASFCVSLAILALSACTVNHMFNPPVVMEKDNLNCLDKEAMPLLVGEWTSPEKDWELAVTVPDKKDAGMLSVTAMIPDGKKENAKKQPLPLIAVPVRLEGRLYAVLFADMERVIQSGGLSGTLTLMVRPWFYMAELELSGDDMKFALADFEKEETKDGKKETVTADPSLIIKDGIVMNSSESLEKLIREKKYFRAEECTFRRVKKNAEKPRVK